MNWLINAIAALVVVVLAALAFGPYLVDWNGFRAAIAATATRAFGTSVAIGGDVSVELLPSPRLVVSDVTVGPPDAPLLTAQRAELDVSLTPLLSRELHVNVLRLSRPTLALRLDERGALALPGRSSAAGERASWLGARRVVVDDIAVTDGTAVVHDARAGTERTLAGIDLAGTARSLAGPFNAAGTVPLAGHAAAVTIAGGELADGTMPLSLRVTPENGPTATLDGRLAVDPAAPSLSGRLRIAGTAALPFGLEGDLSLDPRRAELSSAAATWAEVPLDVSGRATWDLSGREPLTVALEARQVDLDRIERALATPPSDAATPPAVPVAHPPAEALPRLAAAFAPAIAALAPLDAMATVADIDVSAVLVGGAVVRDVSAQLSTGAGGLAVRRAEALLPGDAQAEASGRLSGGAFAGHLRINAPQPTALARWWRGTGVAAAAPPVLAEADVEAAAGRFDARRLSLRVGGTTADGRVRWSAADGGAIEASLDAPLVDVADLSAAAALAPAVPGATAVTLNLAADRVRVGELEGGAAAARAVYRDGTLTLSSLSAADLAGTTLDASGTLRNLMGTPEGRIDGAVSIADGAALSAAVARALPGSALRSAAARVAAAATPAELRLSLSGGTATPLALTLSGTAAGTTLDVAAAGDPLGPDWRAAPLHLSATLANPDGRTLLRQLTLPGGSDPSPGRLAIGVDGVPAAGLAVQATAAAAGAELSFDGTVTVADAPVFAGAAAARIPRLDALGTALGVALPAAAVTVDAAVAGPPSALSLPDFSGTVDGVPVRGALILAERITGRIEADSLNLSRLAGLALGPAPLIGPDGRWSTAAFAPVVAPPRPLAVALAARQASPLRDLRADLALDRTGVRLSGLSAGWAGGRITGAVALAREGAAARLSARTQLEGVRLAEVAWRSAGAPVATGLMRLDADVAATAFTASGLVQNLRGRGRLEVFDGTLALNPRPFDLPLAVLDAPQPPGEAEARALFAAHLDGGSLTFSRLSAALAVEAGVVRLDGLQLAPPPALRFAEAALDLEAWRVHATATVPSALAGTTAAPLSVAFDGPLAAPVRQVDAGALATWIGLRRLERQVEAVEADNRALEAEAAGRPAAAPPPSSPSPLAAPGSPPVTEPPARTPLRTRFTPPPR